MKGSIFDSRLRFIRKVKDVYIMKKSNPEIIRFLWIKKRPVIDEFGELYQGSALITINLN